MTAGFQIVIDCADANQLTMFWAAALGYEPTPPPEGFESWDDYWRDVGVPEEELGLGVDRISDPDGHGSTIWFQVVPERKTLKNRLHLDIRASGGRETPIEDRRSYNEWADFWPDSEIQPFSAFINGVAKYVATSTPLDREWANATAIDGELVEFVKGLKELPGGSIGVHASLSVTRTLLTAGIVDELRLIVAPTITGSEHRLFDGLPPIHCELINSEASPTGHLIVAYKVIP